MQRVKKYLQDADMQSIMGKMLRLGVSLSAVITVLGGLLYMFHHQDIVPEYHVFKGVEAQYTSLSGVLRGVLALKSKAIIQLGVMLLIATPIARVLFSMFAFLLEKDYLYSVITFIVLSIMSFSILTGIV